MATKSRGFCFTINNPTDEDTRQVLEIAPASRYIIVGKEVGDNGTPHYQGYVFFDNPRSWNSIKKQLPRSHLEHAKGTPEENADYCGARGRHAGKPGWKELLLEQGEVPKAGKRNDIQDSVKTLKEGGNMRKVIDEATSYQSIRVAEVWLKYNEKGKDWKPEIRWFHGSTGSGKTRAAVEWLGGEYYKPINFKWWEGYDAHENVLLDEIRGDFCKYHEILALLDRYQYRVECKGGSRQLLAKKIAITSPYRPEDLYHTVEDKQQLLRRIDEVIQCGEVVHKSNRTYDFELLD